MTINSTAVNQVITDNFPKYFSDCVTKNARFIDFLNRNGRIVGLSDPKGPRWEVKVTGHSSAGRYVEGDPLPAAGQFASVTASLGWAQYAATIKLTGKAQAELDAGGNLAVENWLDKQMMEASRQVAVSMNTDALSGDNSASEGFVGITAALAASGTYANISRTTYANWVTYTNTSVGSVSLSNLDTNLDYLTDTIQGNANVVLTTRTVEGAIAALTTGAPSKTIYLANGDTSYSAVVGPGSIDPMAPRTFYRDRPVFVIPGYTAQRLDMVDLSTIGIEVLRDNTGLTGAGAPVMLVDGDDIIWKIVFSGQFFAHEPRMGATTMTGVTA